VRSSVHVELDMERVENGGTVHANGNTQYTRSMGQINRMLGWYGDQLFLG